VDEEQAIAALHSGKDGSNSHGGEEEDARSSVRIEAAIHRLHDAQSRRDAEVATLSVTRQAVSSELERLQARRVANASERENLVQVSIPQTSVRLRTLQEAMKNSSATAAASRIGGKNSDNSSGSDEGLAIIRAKDKQHRSVSFPGPLCIIKM
jgi:hypothetical protein